MRDIDAVSSTNTQPTAPIASERQRFHITLSTAFTWLTLLTLIASHVWTLVQLYNVHEERRVLYQKFGIATVHDPQKVSSAATWFSNERRCRIQVYLPPDRHLVLKYKIKNASNFDYREPQGEIDLGWVSEELLSDREPRFYVDAVTHHLENGGRTEVVVMAGNQSRNYFIDVPEGHILD